MSYSYDMLVKRATVAAISAAILLISIKLISWWLTDSISLLASLLDSSIDFLASGLNFILIRYSLRPPDEGHTFGHGKAESLAALAQSAFIIGSAVILLLSSMKLLINPAPVHQPLIGVFISCLSVVITLVLVGYQRHVIQLTGSQAIKADMLHYSSDLLMNIAVIIALILSWQGMIYADAIFAILIACYIFYSAYRIAFSAIQDLLDKALSPADNERILNIASSGEGVHGVHDLKTRQAGPIKFIQLHLELDGAIPLIQAHAITDRIEHLIAEEFAPAEVIIHQDPISVVMRENSHKEK